MTEQTQKLNTWKVGFFVLLAAIILMGIFFYYQATKEVEVPQPKDIKVHFCEILQGTPSWGNFQGEIFDRGYKDFHAMANKSYDVVNEVLIPDQIFFIYHPDCGWCQKQIEEFGDNWEDYVNSGLTVDCSIN